MAKERALAQSAIEELPRLFRIRGTEIAFAAGIVQRCPVIFEILPERQLIAPMQFRRDDGDIFGMLDMHPDVVAGEPVLFKHIHPNAVGLGVENGSSFKLALAGKAPETAA